MKFPDISTKATLNLQIFQMISNPHQATMTAYLHQKHRIHSTQSLHTATRFANILGRNIANREPFKAEEKLQADPFDIIVFVNEAGLLLYSVMIDEIDLDKMEVSVIEVKDPFGIRFSDLSKVIKNKRSFTPYLFKSSEVDALLRKSGLLRK